LNLKKKGRWPLKTIACFGSGSGAPGDAMYDAMLEVGRLLATLGYRVATGGFGGSGMEAPARGARVVGGTAIGYTMLGKKPNAFITAEVDCSRIPYLTIPPEMQYGIRLGRLLEADGFIIAANGGPGTMVELLAIINLNYKFPAWKANPKRFTLLNPSYGVGWDAKMGDQLSELGVFPREILPLYIISRTPQEAVDWVCQ